METMKKRIGGLGEEELNGIARTFGVTRKTVFNALTFDAKRGYTDKARRIRSYARQKGGYEVVTVPVSEMLHDSDGHMRQYFANGMTLDCDKASGRTVLRDRDGVETLEWDNPTLTEIAGIQRDVCEGMK